MSVTKNIKPLYSPTTYLKSCGVCTLCAALFPLSGNLTWERRQVLYFFIRALKGWNVKLLQYLNSCYIQFRASWWSNQRNRASAKTTQHKGSFQYRKSCIVCMEKEQSLSDEWCNLDLTLSLCMCVPILFVHERIDFNQTQQYVC